VKSCDEDQAKYKVEAHSLLELCVSGRGHGRFGGLGCPIFTAHVGLVDATSQWVGDQKEGQVGNVVAKAGILRIGVVLGRLSKFSAWLLSVED